MIHAETVNTANFHPAGGKTAGKKTPYSARRNTAKYWDRTIFSFDSRPDLTELCLDQTSETPETRISRDTFNIRASRDDRCRQSASLLIEKMYSWRGYDVSDSPGKPYQITLVAHQDEQVVGTLSLGLDSRKGGLMVDQLYRDEVDQLRKQGRRLCDVTRLAVDHHVQSTAALGAIFHLSVILGRHIHRATDFLIEVNPRHANFYKKMIGFEQIGGTRLCERVNAPAVLLRLDLDYADEQIRRFGGRPREAHQARSIYPHWFSKADEEGIARRLHLCHPEPAAPAKRRAVRGARDSLAVV